MTVKFRVVRQDTKAPVPGAKIVLEHGDSDGITNVQGEAEISTSWSGNLLYSVDASGYGKKSGTTGGCVLPGCIVGIELGAVAAPETSPAPGETVIGSVGKRCDLVQKGAFGTIVFAYRDRYSGFHSNWDPSFDRAQSAAEGNAVCFADPPPPPRSVDDVQKDVDILRGTLQGVSERVQDALSGLSQIGKDILDLEARLKAWIEEQILVILLRALDREVEKRGR